ncbi:MAG TPA: glycosyltransferase family 4 protein [Gemmatimonadaceae bacterium]|nr:glycosyltransferase family 4 protein [Gemmatimonadaceae bacterium]
MHLGDPGASDASRPRRWLFVNAHYYPDIAATAHHLTDLAEFLAARGHDVTVVTGRGKYVAGAVRAPAREMRNGVRIRRVAATAFGRGTHLGRLADYATFYVQALAALLGPARYDAAVVLTTPPLLSFAARVARALRGRRYAVWSQDLHPDAEFAAGMLSPRSVIGRLLEAMNAAGYRGADLVVDLGAYMRERIAAKGVSPARSTTIPVWIGSEELAPVDRAQNDFVREHGLEGKFVVAYIGNAGIVHEFEPVLAAMEALRDDPRIHFLFVGDGPQRARIERFAAERALPNVTFRGYMPREHVRELYSAADAHLVTLRDRFVGIAVPTKLYQAMGAGRPVVFVGPRRSESADAVTAADGGTVVDPADGDAAAALVATLRRWQAEPALAASLGARARAYVVREHDRERGCARFESALVAAVAGASEPLATAARAAAAR